ncbi:putative zinc transporter 10 [Asimina triloba]
MPPLHGVIHAAKIVPFHSKRLENSVYKLPASSNMDTYTQLANPPKSAKGSAKMPSWVLIMSSIFFFIMAILSSHHHALAQSNTQDNKAETTTSSSCMAESGDCIDKAAALPLKIIAIVSILVTSIIGVCLPLFSRHVPALHPDRALFVVIKAFAAGIILATGFMHVLPDSFDFLRSECLPDNPWHNFPFSGFLAMLSAIGTLMVDSLATSVYRKRSKMNGVTPESNQEVVHGDSEMGMGGHFHQAHAIADKDQSSQLLRYRVVAMVLELGIVVHSVVIGLSLGASNNTCSIKPLVAALCFHQMFEGMGLGGCILQAAYKLPKQAAMVFFFATTTPFGIALGIAISNVYRENSPTSLIVIGLLNASSAGLLIYMALVDLLASDFMGPKLQGSIKLQIQSYIAVLLGAGGMSLMAKWA